MPGNNRFIAFLSRIPNLFERREFRNRIREERSKKYLVPKTEARSGAKVLETLSNPRKRTYAFASTFYSRLEETGKRHTASFAVLGIFILLLCGYVVFGSPYFRISASKVIIERLDAGSDVNVAYKSIEPVYGKPIFSVTGREVSRMVIGTQKNVERAEVSKLYPNGLKIVLSSRPPEFFTYFPKTERYYGITGNGILVYQKSKGTDLPMLDIVDPSFAEGEFLDYKEGVSPGQMERIRTLRKAFAESYPESNVAKFTFFKTERELHIAFESGIRLLFSLDGTESEQFAKFRFWNAGEGSPIVGGKISYVDLRIPGKVFVCRDEGVCKKNLLRIYGDRYK